MKRIEAIIRRTKFEEVKEALDNVGIEWFTYSNVRGLGKSRQERIYRGITYDTSNIERIMITIVVREKYLEKTIDAILKNARSGECGEIGDGRIFVSSVEEIYKIRTGEKGDQVLKGVNDES